MSSRENIDFRIISVFIPKEIKNLLMLRKVKVSAPGKIILSGEHAVVYGYPAILAAIDRRLSIEVSKGKKSENLSLEGKKLLEFALNEINKDLGKKRTTSYQIKIDSQIPIGCGMGSSAAFAVALAAAVLCYYDEPWGLERINKIAYEIEKKQHGNPSGGDNTISTYGGFLLYRKETETFKVFSSLKTQVFPSLFLINSGKPIETTGEMVDKVKRFRLKFPNKVEKIFEEMEQVTRGFLRFLSKEESNLGELIKTNEELLEALGVVSERTMNLIQKIEKIGGSAKISGAGGTKDNSGIIITYHPDQEKLFSFAKKESLDIFRVKLGEKGVRIEKH